MEGLRAFQRLAQGFQGFGNPDISGAGHESPEVVICDEQRSLRLELLRRGVRYKSNVGSERYCQSLKPKPDARC